jgi:hypothetical protein
LPFSISSRNLNLIKAIRADPGRSTGSSGAT